MKGMRGMMTSLAAVAGVVGVLLLATVGCSHGSVALPRDVVSKFYIPIPGGLCLSHCVRQVPSGWSVSVSKDVSKPLSEANHLTVPPCPRPEVQLGPNNETIKLPVFYNRHKAKASAQLPPNYDGWLAYTAYNISGTFTSFVGKMSVPNKPDRTPDRLYLFTGVQNKDWVPLHDPESEGVGFDVLQPVMQFSGALGRYWGVKSWYVTLEAGAIASTEVALSPGDVVLGNITMVAPDTWHVVSTNMRTGKSTGIRPKSPRLATQPWAYNVMEAYGVQGCNFYPTTGSQFTDLSLTTQSGQITPAWRKNPKPDPVHKCNEDVAVHGADAMTFTFQ